MTNNGGVNATELVYTLSSDTTSSALAQEAYVCLGSTGIGTGGSFFPLYNGPISGLAPLSLGQQGDVLTVANSTPTPTSGPTDNVVINVYAGLGEPTACGTSTAQALDNSAMGESITLSGEMTYQG